MQGQIFTEIQMVAAFVLVWLLFGLGWHTCLCPNSSDWHSGLSCLASRPPPSFPSLQLLCGCIGSHAFPHLDSAFLVPSHQNSARCWKPLPSLTLPRETLLSAPDCSHVSLLWTKPEAAQTQVALIKSLGSSMPFSFQTEWTLEGSSMSLPLRFPCNLAQWPTLKRAPPADWVITDNEFLNLLLGKLNLRDRWQFPFLAGSWTLMLFWDA